MNVGFDYTSDTPHYWEGFWDDGIGSCGKHDPDRYSRSLLCDHCTLWKRELPNGVLFSPTVKSGYLIWNGQTYGSDSITASFRYVRYKHMLDKVAADKADYRAFVEDYLHKLYTIGGSIIFPAHRNSINQMRGCNKKISDRWDLTLECIKRFYEGKPSPLSKYLEADRNFFMQFCSFKEYVDFFFLQDCVTEDYSEVLFWLGNGDFETDPLPQTIEEYYSWIDDQLHFVELRNKRISSFLSDKKQ